MACGGLCRLLILSMATGQISSCPGDSVLPLDFCSTLPPYSYIELCHYLTMLLTY